MINLTIYQLRTQRVAELPEPMNWPDMERAGDFIAEADDLYPLPPSMAIAMLDPFEDEVWLFHEDHRDPTVDDPPVIGQRPEDHALKHQITLDPTGHYKVIPRQTLYGTLGPLLPVWFFAWDPDEIGWDAYMAEAYAHGGGWQPFKGHELLDQQGTLQYLPNSEDPDPPMMPYAKMEVKGWTIFYYPHAWLTVVNPNGIYETARID